MSTSTRNEWSVKRGDTYGYITEQLLDENLDPVNLSGSTVKFVMKQATDAVAKVNAAASILDEPEGIVRYAWVGTDTSVAGDFEQEWQVVFTAPGSEVLTFPNDGYNVIHVLKDLGD